MRLVCLASLLGNLWDYLGLLLRDNLNYLLGGEGQFLQQFKFFDNVMLGCRAALLSNNLT